MNGYRPHNWNAEEALSTGDRGASGNYISGIVGNVPTRQVGLEEASGRGERPAPGKLHRMQPHIQGRETPDFLDYFVLICVKQSSMQPLRCLPELHLGTRG